MEAKHTNRHLVNSSLVNSSVRNTSYSEDNNYSGSGAAGSGSTTGSGNAADNFRPDNFRPDNFRPDNFRSHALAPVQRETLEYLRRFISENGYGPTLKDIATYIGVRSPSTAHFHLSRLEDKGFIKRGEDGSIELVERDELRTPAGAFAVPLMGLIAAGSPIEAIEDTSVMIDIPPQFMDKRGDIFCLQVTGDSMIDAHIMDGDIIVVRGQDTADNGQIVVALLDGNATVKTFRRLKGGKVMLVPHNPSHQPIPADHAEIRGRVIGLIREI